MVIDSGWVQSSKERKKSMNLLLSMQHCLFVNHNAYIKLCALKTPEITETLHNVIIIIVFFLL